MAHPLTAALLALHATTTAIAVQHVHLSGHKPFDEVCSKIESNTGRLDLAKLSALFEKKDFRSKVAVNERLALRDGHR